jgi:hypothetical protein
LKFTAAGVLTPSNDLQTAVDTNALQTMWVAADTTLSNNLEAMYIAADVVVSSAYGAADTAVSNNLKAMYIAADGVLSNNVLAVYAAADTALSNNLVTMYTAADLAMSNNIATEFITSNSIWLATMVAKSETQAVNVAFAITNLPIGSLVYTGGNSVEDVATNAATAATNALYTIVTADITTLSNAVADIGYSGSATDLDSGTVPLARLVNITSNQIATATDTAYRAGGGQTVLIHASAAAEQTLTGGWETLSLTENIDIGGDFATSTFTVPTTGNYRFTVYVPYELTTQVANETSVLNVRIRKNGATTVFSGRGTKLEVDAVGGDVTLEAGFLSMHWVAPLVATDTIVLQGTISASDLTLNVAAGGGQNMTTSYTIENL